MSIELIIGLSAILLTAIVSIFGYLLSRMINQNDTTNTKQDDDIRQNGNKITALSTQVLLNGQKDDLVIKPLENKIAEVHAEVKHLSKKFDTHMESHQTIREYVDQELLKIRDELKK
jgi:hypothetical protein